MPLLSVGSITASSKRLQQDTLANFTDVVAAFSYGENADMVVRKEGIPTNGNGIILSVHNVFQLNESMLSTFRGILSREEFKNYDCSIEFDNNSIVYTIYFGEGIKDKKTFCYNKHVTAYLTNPLLYIGILFIWNPQRYLFFL